MKTGMCTLIAGLLMLSPADGGDPSAGAVLKALEGSNPDIGVKDYLFGIIEGLSWANVRLSFEQKPKLFCEPDKIALTSEQAIDILRRYVDGHPRAASSSFGMVMMDALTDAFPCK
jgi:hypothetical protein